MIMKAINDWDNIESFQLKECYDLAVQFERLDIAKDVLRDKSRAINIPQGFIPVQQGMSLPETEMIVTSEILQELSREGYIASGNGPFYLAHKLDALPPSAEKEYYLAILSLREGTNETHRMKAMQHIGNALSIESEDPRYVVLARVLQEASR